jgi:iron only hydrogenase large subunit-like protein
LTFIERREIFGAKTLRLKILSNALSTNLSPASAQSSQTGGLFQTAGIQEDLIKGNVGTAESGNSFVEVFREFDENGISVQLLESLACNGCIMGPGVSTDKPLFGRKASVSKYVQGKLKN